ncbi:MAG: ATP-binding cassette domain-containing protein, partial [Ilumatobacter sp.]
GIAYVSEDRRGQSIINEFPILDNASLPMIDHTTRQGLVRRSEELDLVGDSLDRMKLRFHSFLQPISALSGGNQQKVVLAKWLASNPKLLILDEPTQGIDIQAKAEVHKIIDELASTGIAIIVISSDMPELIANSDRVLVLKHGDVTAELEGDDITPINIGLAATGSAPDDQLDDLTGVADRSSSTTDPVIDTPDTASSSSAEATSTATSLVRRFVKQREFGLAAALAVIVVPLTLYNTNFYTGANVRDLFIYASLIGIVGIGEMMVIITRNIDLSVASTLALAAYGAAATMRSSPNSSIFLGIGVALAIGLAAGLVNGLLVAYGEVPSIVVTLGTLAVYRGILSEWSSGDRVTPGDVESGGWLDWTRHEPFGIPIIAIIGLVVFVGVGFAMRRLRRGRETYCVGSNPEGAALVGIRVKRRVLGSFTACGVLAGLVGAMWASFYPYVDGQVAYGLELTVISGVVVGGVALRGGAGTVVGVAVGTLGLLAIRKSLTIAGVDDQYLLAIYGAAIIVAVSVDGIIKWFSDTRKAVAR